MLKKIPMSEEFLRQILELDEGWELADIRRNRSARRIDFYYDSIRNQDEPEGEPV